MENTGRRKKKKKIDREKVGGKSRSGAVVRHVCVCVCVCVVGVYGACVE